VVKQCSKWQKELDREVAWAQSFRHPNLAHLLELYRYEDTAWLVMEYCDAGNLVDLIPVAAMKEEEIAYVAKQILRALNYLHRNGRMHRGTIVTIG
jgi:serine/threonine protein kinase